MNKIIKYFLLGLQLVLILCMCLIYNEFIGHYINLKLTSYIAKLLNNWWIYPLIIIVTVVNTIISLKKSEIREKLMVMFLSCLTFSLLVTTVLGYILNASFSD